MSNSSCILVAAIGLLTFGSEGQCQTIEDAGAILYDANRGRVHWTYDDGLKIKEDKILLSDSDEFFLYGNTNLAAETLLSVTDKGGCIIEVLKRVREDRFEKDASNLSVYLERGFGSPIPDPVLDEMKKAFVKETFYLNNVVVNEIKSKRNVGQNQLGQIVTNYEFSLVGFENLYCRETKLHSINTSSGKYTISEKANNTCEKEITLTVEQNKVDRLKNVLSFLYGKACRGAKRDGRF